MKNFNKITNLIAILTITFSFVLTSCDKDDDDDNIVAPQIIIEEANIEGDELCVEADIKAAAQTQSIVIKITDASGATVKATKEVADTKYIGVLNIDGFHVHVDIANKNVQVGDILQLTVTDQKGNSTTQQKSITQEEEDEDE